MHQARAKIEANDRRHHRNEAPPEPEGEHRVSLIDLRGWQEREEGMRIYVVTNYVETKSLSLKEKHKP